MSTYLPCQFSWSSLQKAQLNWRDMISYAQSQADYTIWVLNFVTTGRSILSESLQSLVSLSCLSSFCFLYILQTRTDFIFLHLTRASFFFLMNVIISLSCKVPLPCHPYPLSLLEHDSPELWSAGFTMWFPHMLDAYMSMRYKSKTLCGTFSKALWKSKFISDWFYLIHSTCYVLKKLQQVFQKWFPFQKHISSTLSEYETIQIKCRHMVLVWVVIMIGTDIVGQRACSCDVLFHVL